jgi:hypothetical protein
MAKCASPDCICLVNLSSGIQRKGHAHRSDACPITIPTAPAADMKAAAVIAASPAVEIRTTQGRLSPDACGSKVEAQLAIPSTNVLYFDQCR